MTAPKPCHVTNEAQTGIMNTNYAKWEKFDVDEELEEIDRKQKVEEFKAAQIKQTKTALTLEEERQKKAREVATKAAKTTPSTSLSSANTSRDISRNSVSGSVAQVQVDSSSQNDVDLRTSGEDKSALTFHLRYSRDFDGSDVPMRMLMISTAITDIIQIVHALQKCLDTCDFAEGYIIGRKGIIMISEVVEFQERTKPLVTNSKKFPSASGVGDFISCVECNTTVLPPTLPIKSKKQQPSSSSSTNAKELVESCCANCKNVLPSVLIHGSAEVTAPDGNTSTFDGSVASVLKLRTVAISLTAQIAYYLGELAVAAELTRCAIKLREEEHQSNASKMKIIETDDITMWVIRGGAFALMGNFYMARVHFQHAKSLLATFPDINKLLLYSEELEERNCTKFLPVVEELLEDASRSNAVSWQQRLLNDVKVLSGILFREDQFYREQLVLAPSERKRRMRSNSIIDVGFLREMIEERHGNKKDSMIESLYEYVDYDRIKWLEIIKRVFYEGQMLFLEQMYHSADAKFTMSLAMAIMHIRKASGKSLSVLEFLGTCETKDKYLNGIKVACLTNIAKCRFHRHQGKSLKSHFVEDNCSCYSYEDIVKRIVNMDALDLCNFALEDNTLLWHDEVSILLTKVDLLQCMKNYEDCLGILEMIRTTVTKNDELADEIQDVDDSCLTVRGYEKDTLYTQNFICGMSLVASKQHDNPKVVYSNIEHSFKDKLLRKVENRKTRITYLQKTKR